MCDNGLPSQVRFGLQRPPLGGFPPTWPLPTYTNWQAKSIGEPFQAQINVDPGKEYSFWAEAQNSAGASRGETLTFTTPNGIQVPALKNMTKSQAQAALQAVGLVLGAVGGNPDGKVASQVPGAGQQACPGSPVAITLGLREVAVPNVIGMSEPAAKAALEDAGFVVNLSYGPSEQAEGTVFSQDPAGGTMLLEGSDVNLTISQADGGPGPGPGPGPSAGDLVGHWKLDETAGTTAADASGNNYNGTLYGGPVWQPTGGKLAGALQLDGVNDYGQLPIGPVLSSLTNSTFATWVNWSGIGGDWQRIFDFGSGTNSYMFLTPRNPITGSMRFAITTAGSGGEDQATAPQALTTGWHHLAVTIDAASKIDSLYLDGQAVATKTGAQHTPSSLGNTTQNWLGRSQWPDPYFNGSLDDFRIYDRVLSAAEVAQLTRGGANANLVARWELDETGGDIVYDSAGQNDGVAYGQPSWQASGGKISGALKLDGVNDYVQLPIGSLISSLTDSTFAAWVNWTGASDWQRIFDFGSGTNAYMFLTPRAPGGSLRFAITAAGNGAEDQAAAAQALATGWHHVAVTIDATSKTHLLYLDGNVVATKTATRYTPSSLGNTTQNWLGRSQWPDPYFNGSLDDLRIYDKVLTTQEVQQAMLGATSPGGGAIPVENFSFELPGTVKIKGWNGEGVGGTPAVDIPGWRSDSPAADSGVETGRTPTDGLWTAFLMGGDPAVWQLTNHTMAAGEVFELKVNARINGGAPMLLMVLYYETAGVRMPAALQAFILTPTMQEYSLRLKASDVPACIGKKIGIEFTNATPGGGNWLGIDKVRLSLVQ